MIDPLDRMVDADIEYWWEKRGKDAWGKIYSDLKHKDEEAEQLELLEESDVV